MFVSRVLARASRAIPRSSSLLSSSQNQHVAILSNQFHSLVHESPNKFVPGQVSLFHLNSYPYQRFGISSSASPEPSEKGRGTSVENNGDAKVSDQTEGSNTGESKAAGQTNESDSENEDSLTMDDLVKLLMEKEELLKSKNKEMEIMQDKVLRSYAEMENVMERTKREAGNSKKFAIQNFAKSLLDVADNLGRASSVVKESFSKLDTSNDSSGAVPLLKTLLEGVEMTEKQLGEVLKKHGLEKYDPINEPFDPHRHNAVFQISDASKPPGTVAVVLKSGYMLYDRVIRPAEVGVTQAVENDENQ
ncbi:hypothetical protein UlMin_003705 [Ulmus minor]